MKKLFRLFLCLALFSGTAACSDDEASQNLIVINGGEHFLSLDGLARAGKISVLAPAPWRVTKAAGDTWFTLSATEGPAGYSEVELSLDENPGAARSAQLAFACGDAIVPFRLSQGALSAGYDSPDYYFYVTFGTMPTLYAGIHLLSHDKPSYVFYSRSRTFDPAEFPGRAEVTTAADRTADATQAEMEAMAREMKRRILEINSADPTAVFGLYVDDLRCRIGYDWFVAQGIDSARVKVSMLSDGTGTYNNFYNYFGDGRTELGYLCRRGRGTRLEPRRTLSRDPFAARVRKLYVALLPFHPPRLPAGGAGRFAAGKFLSVHHRKARGDGDRKYPAL